ncbi:AMP-binding protein [Limnovirga soli]|uniref:AMP-binding protein n=1 Tax=Limnovirga soli TaxID=2656915 RepID=A0A8J8FLH2_9BACT|nr:AMP-binding protein [Limnovirga soli]NNV58036.1 AMP-binding protein [Limnovirga soli]
MSFVYKLYQSLLSNTEHIAITDGNVQISYQQLLQKSLAIAQAIQANEYKGGCIAIVVEDGITHISAILGIVFSGNYYLSVTKDNQHFLADQSGLHIKAIITDDAGVIAGLEQIPHLQTAQIFNTTKAPLEILAANYTNEMPFCAFSTSGSTGSPKIVIHAAENIDNDTMRQIVSNNITAADRIDLVFSFSFSASLACIFPALLAGATICMFNIKKEGIHQLKQFWQKQYISFSTLSVSSFRTLFALHHSFTDVPHIRFISIGAEPVTDEDVQLFTHQFLPGTILQISYATTETRTITEVKITNGQNAGNFLTSAGKVVQGKAIVILDKQGNACAANTVGEIAVHSAYIARAYAGNAAATAQAFSINGKQITYHTGDMGYINNEGYLFITGRKYFTSKINGIQINLQFIEKTIQQITHATQVAAIIQTGITGVKQIKIYFQSPHQPDIEKLKEQLRNLLPESHLPHSFTRIDHLPVTHTGKLDRKSLEKLVLGNATTPNAMEQLGSVEQTIVDVFNQVLGIQHTSLNSNYFTDLGGDSLNCFVCIHQLEKQLNTQIPNHAIFTCPTPLLLAKYLSYNLFQNSITHQYINQYIPGRKTICFIDLQNAGTYQHCFQNKALASYNLLVIGINIFAIADFNNARAATQIMEQCLSVLSTQNGLILVGYSFWGYMAFQLSAKLPNAQLLVMIDTPHYFNYALYTNNTKTQTIKNILTTAISQKSWQLPWQAIQMHRQKKRAINSQKINGANYSNGINYLVQYGHQLNTNTPILFIKSLEHIGHKQHGSNWQPHSSKKLIQKTIYCNHQQLMQPKNAAQIVDLIVQQLQ